MRTIIFLLFLLLMLTPADVAAQGARVAPQDPSAQRSKEINAALAAYQRATAGLEDAVITADAENARKRISDAEAASHLLSDRIVGSLDTALTDVDNQLAVSEAFARQVHTLLNTSESGNIADHLAGLDKALSAMAASTPSDRKESAAVGEAVERLRERLKAVRRLRQEQTDTAQGMAETVNKLLDSIERNNRDLTSQKETLSSARSLEVEKRRAFDEYFRNLNEIINRRGGKRP